MNKKRIIALLVCFVLVISTAFTVSAAAFPDIEARHSWAEDAIDDMVDRGILKGYTDGTFKPDKAVTKLETLIIASRIMGVDEDENAEYRAAAVKKYENTLAPYDISFKDEIAYLLYRNVIKTNELSSYISDSAKNQALKRYEAAILLTKLVGGEDAALAESVIVLDFADASSIPSSAKAYVKYISEIGLMKGMEENRFNPSGELTRAMISTVMYRAEEYMEETLTTGTVEKVSDSSITALINGKSQEIAIPEGTVIKVDASEIALGKLSVNQLIRIHYQGNAIRFIDALSSNLYYTVSGTITTKSSNSGVKTLVVANASGSKTYTISDTGCEYLIDNKLSTFANLPDSCYVVLTIQAGVVTKVVVETGAKSVNGKLTGVTLGEDFVAISVETTDGDDVEYIVNEEVTITRNNKKSDIRSLSAGDTVKVTLENGGVSKIVATSSSKSMTGTITKIVISSNSTITVKTGTDEYEYGITSDTQFVVDGKEDCTIYDLRLGASADIRLDSTNITRISTQSMVVSPTLTGVITYVHPTSYVMGLQVFDAATGEAETIQTVVKSTVKVTDTTSSNVSSFKSLEPGMTVVVVGTSKYGVYEVNQIIVTAKVD